MFRSHSRRFLLLLAMLAALVVAAALPASAAPAGTTPRAFPGFGWSSCHDLRSSFPFAPDGVYPLLVGNTVVTVFCYDMGGTPREYIELAHTGGNANFSQYTAGGASPGTNVRTSFTKVRFDPKTMTVDIGDLTFATTTGRLQHSSLTRGPSSPFVTAMPYATAMSCTTRPDGVGNVNLQGTPFVVDDTFQVRSFAGSGSATVSPDKQNVDLLVSGYCGWISAAPAIDPGYNPQPGNFRLNLACAPTDIQAALPSRQYCITLR